MAGIFGEAERDWVSMVPAVTDGPQRPADPFLESLRAELRSADDAEAAPAPTMSPTSPNGTSAGAAQCFAGLYDPDLDPDATCESTDVESSDAPSLEERDPREPRARSLRPRQRYGKVKTGEYQFIVRSFAPFDQFGLGYEGDDRTFSTSLDATSRITQTINLTPGPHASAKSKAWSDPSRGSGIVPHLLRFWSQVLDVDRGVENAHFTWEEMEATAKPRDSVSMRTVGSNHMVDAKYAGSMPLSSEKITPDIDVSTTLVIARDQDVLHVFGSIRGDAFPNCEVLARDAAGHVMFLHGFQTSWGREGPFGALFGEGQTPMGSFMVDIKLDPDGNFLGARLGGKSLSVGEYSEARQELAGRPR